MKTFKSLALIAGLALITANVSAQEKAAGMDPGTMATKLTAQVKASVTGLTADQESKVLSVEQDFAKSAQDARTSSNGDHDAMRAKMKPLREARDTKIKAILTDSQYAEYTKAEEAHKGGHGGGGN